MDVLSALSSPGVSAARKEQSLGQDAFMTLMLAQFNAQNPLEPMANTEFLGQLAQFSVVSGVQQLDASFQALAQRLSGDQVLQGASLLGKPVQYWTDSLHWDGHQPPVVHLDVPPGSSRVEVDVFDGGGARVARLVQDAPGAELRFAWDGRDSGGQALPAGDYRIEARAVTGQHSEALAVRGEAAVAAVMPSAQGLVLELAHGRLLPLANVIQIRTADPA